MTRKVSPLYVKPDQVRRTFGGLSLNSQFKVALHFGQAPKNSGNADTDTLVGHLNNCGIFERGQLRSTSDGFDFYAAEAELPGANFDVTEQPGGYQGLLEYNATRRIYPDFNVTFYVDTEYYIIRMFEEWLNFINPIYGSKGKYIGGSLGMRGFGDEEPGAYYRMSYPRGHTGYKHDISITKFERDFLKDPNEDSQRFNLQTLIAYQFIDAFPKQVTAMPVSYQGSELLQCSVTFGYTRYITMHSPGGKLYDSENNYATRSSRKTRGSTTVPSKNISADTNAPLTTVPEGSFNITNSATSAKRQVEAQVHKDTALYGDTFPPGSFGISKKVRREIGVDNARNGSRSRNRRRGSGARNRTRAMRDMSVAEQQSINDSATFF